MKDAVDEKCGNCEEDPMQEAWKTQESNDSFDYEKWLKERADEVSQIKLILYYYHVNRIEDSIEVLKDLNLAHKRIYFRDESLRNEFMDFGFLLAESLIERKEYYDAYIILDYIIRLEFGCHYFKHFILESLEMASKILRHCIDKKIPDELAIDCWERALELGFSEKDNQYSQRKIAEAYQRVKRSYYKAA